MIGLLKEPLPIYQSFCKEIWNTWNIHINEILNKASKGIYFVVQLKRAKVARTDLGLFYSSCIRSIMDYAVPAFHFSLPKYLMQALERIQKRAKSIICPGVSYHEALVIMNFEELPTHHDEICESLFHTIVNKRAQKGVNSTSGTQFAALPLVNPFVQICTRSRQQTFPFCC